MNKKNINITLSSLFFAIAIVLPFFTGQIREIGKMLLPMHLPIFLCGLICGPYYGLIVGLITPIFRSIVVGMPVLYPNALAMAVELASYGFISGFIYKNSKNKTIFSIYKSLIIAMILGRIIWGICQVLLMQMVGNAFTFTLFIANGFLSGIPGIIMQLVLIPIIITAINKTYKNKELKKC